MRDLFLFVFAFIVFNNIGYAQHAKFDKPNIQTVGSPFTYVSTGDINGDGLTDLIGINVNIEVWLQNSTGQLQPPLHFPHPKPGFYSCITTADLYKDGTANILIGVNGSTYIYSWINNTLVLTDTLFTATSKQTGITTGDFDGDGLTDIGVSHFDGGHIAVIYQNGESNTKWDIRHYYNIPGEFDGHVVAGKFGPLEQEALVYINIKMDTPATVMTFSALRAMKDKYYLQFPDSTIHPYAHSAAIVNKGIGKPAELWVTLGGNGASSNVAVWKGLQTNPDIIIRVPDVPEAIQSANLDCDEDDEPVILHGGWSNATVFTDTQNLYHVPTPSHYQQEGVALGDINNDGFIDICVANWPDKLMILYNITPQCWPAEVKNISTQSQVSIYPNPAGDIVSIGYSGKADLEIMDIRGSSLYKASFDQKASINMAHWPAGIYFVIMHADGQVLTKKLVKN